MNNPDLVVIGMGYIGLPTAALLSSKGLKVLGIDINQDIVDKVNKGETHFYEPDLDKLVKESVFNKNLFCSTKLTQANIYLIVVPTPFKSNFEPDTSYIFVTKKIIKLLKVNDLIILESTSQWEQPKR